MMYIYSFLEVFFFDCSCSVCFFFFQAEDGIRDGRVTGVQTCALPICRPPSHTPTPAPEPPATAPTAASSGLDEARVFAGLEGANEGLLLIDGAGRVLGGSLKDKAGTDVTDAVAAYLAGVSQEAARTAKLLGLGAWMGLSAEGQNGNVHLAHPTPEALLLVVRERGMPLGRLAILAQRATLMARRWLEKQ